MFFVKKLKLAVVFQILKVKEKNLLPLEDASRVIYAADEYNKDKGLKA